MKNAIGEELRIESELSLQLYEPIQVGRDGSTPYAKPSRARVHGNSVVRWKADAPFTLIFAGGEEGKWVDTPQDCPGVYESSQVGGQHWVTMLVRTPAEKHTLYCKYTLIVDGVPRDPTLIVEP
jgi:hypothetical protein